jgi:hypothetical protein
VDFETKDEHEFECELVMALEWRPASPDLKRKVLERRRQENAQRRQTRVMWWQRVAASLAIAGAAGGAVYWRHAQEIRKGEAAKQQVFTALRIASRALQQMNVQLEQRNENAE